MNYVRLLEDPMYPIIWANLLHNTERQKVLADAMRRILDITRLCFIENYPIRAPHTLDVLDSHPRFDRGVCAWAESGDHLVIAGHLLDSRDSLLLQTLGHEMVHLRQYESVIGMVIARTIGRKSAEAEADRFGHWIESHLEREWNAQWQQS
jgi:hypothetical protein